MSISLTFQVAFASQPGDDPYVWTTVAGTQDISYSRGAPNEYAQMETGESTVTVADADSSLDPENAGSPHYPNVKRGRAIRCFVTVDGTDYPLFQHFIDRLPRAVAMTNWTQRTVKGVDAFGGFALARLGGFDPTTGEPQGAGFPAEASGSRWSRVLDGIGWAASRRDIDTGSSNLDAYTNDVDTEEKALPHLLSVVESENGLGFMDAAGNARFIERHAFILDTTVAATFADGVSLATGDYPDALPYQDLQQESTDILNDYTGKRTTEGATVLTASDATSIDDYGQRSKDVTLLVDSDNEVLDSISWKLSQTKDPHERVDAITVMPGNDATRWATLAGLEVGDRVLVVEQPAGYDAPVEAQYIIRHLDVKLPTALSASEFTFQLTPVSRDAWFVLDDPVAGMLDSNKLAY